MSAPPRAHDTVKEVVGGGVGKKGPSVETRNLDAQNH